MSRKNCWHFHLLVGNSSCSAQLSIFITSGPGRHFLGKSRSFALLCFALSAVFSSLSLLVLTYCILVDFSTVICWTSPFFILGVSGLFCRFYSVFDGKSCLQTL